MAIGPTNNPCGTHGGDHLTDTEMMVAALTGLPKAHPRMQDARIKYMAGKVKGGSVETALNSLMCDYLNMSGLVATYEFRLGMFAGYDPDGRTPPNNELHREVVELMGAFNAMVSDEGITMSEIGSSDAKGEVQGLVQELRFASSGSRKPPPWSYKRGKKYRRRILRQVKIEQYYKAIAAVAGQDAQARILVDQQREINALVDEITPLARR